MSSNGSLIDADALRKKVSGIDDGFMPASLTCDSKLVICAITRHGLVTGETNRRASRSTVSTLVAAVSMAARSARSPAVLVAAVSIFAAPLVVLTHQASEVRRTETVMSWALSVVRPTGRYRIRCVRLRR